MKKQLLICVAAILTVPFAYAEKPEWAGNGKPTVEQKEAHTAAMRAKGGSGERAAELEGELKDKAAEERERARGLEEKLKETAGEREVKAEKQNGKIEKLKKEGEDELKGVEKQRDKKAEQSQNELGKGSEKGERSRDDRRKWWKFWGD